MPLTRLARELGDSPAYIMSDTGAALTYRQLEEQSNQTAHLFRRRGLRPGDHVAIIFGNQLEIFPVIWAALRSGLYITPVNWHLSPDEAVYIVDNCQAKILIADIAHAELAGRCTEGAPRLEGTLLFGGDVPGTERLDHATAGLPVTPIDDELEGKPMYYSSGTTGRPKGILPVLPNVPFGTPNDTDEASARYYGFGRDTTMLSPGPIYHAAPLALSLTPIRQGGRVIVMPRFDASDLLRVIDEHGVTHFQAVPTMFVRMLKLPDEERRARDVSSLRAVVHAAAPCPIDVKEKIIDWFGPIVSEYYGGSEGSGSTIIDTPTWLEHKGSVGQAAFGSTVHISNDGVTDLPPGQIGTIWFSGGDPWEYFNEPEKTRESISPRGWCTLGDVGHLDEDGFLYISDRRTDLIISGGVNIYPREIEEALALHPAVADVGVIGLPDDEMGQRVHAVVQPSDQATAGSALETELIDFVRGKIASYKAPKSVEFRHELPRLPSGKMQRGRLRDLVLNQKEHHTARR
ncbi:AMP-binding protein [Rhodococcus koreensis]